MMTMRIPRISAIPNIMPVGMSISVISLTSEQILYQALKAQEGDGDQGSGDESDRKSFQSIRHIRFIDPRANAREEEERERKADTCTKSVDHRLCEGVVAVDVQDRNAEDSTVRGDQGEVDAQCFVQRRHRLFHDHLDHLYECGDNENKDEGLQVSEFQRIQKQVLDRPGDRGGDQHDADDRARHTHRGLKIFRYSEERTDTHELRKNEVINEDRGEDNDQKILCHLFLPLSFAQAAAPAGQTVGRITRDTARCGGFGRRVFLLLFHHGLYDADADAEYEESARREHEEHHRFDHVSEERKLHVKERAASQDLTDGAHHEKCERKSGAHRKTVENRRQDLLLAGKCFRTCKKDTVYNDKGDIDAQ